jgi:predicted ATPase
MDDDTLNHWSYLYDSEGDVLKIHAEKCESELSSLSLFSNHFEYIYAERLGPRNLYPKSSMIVSEKQQLGNAGEYTEHYLLLNGDDLISNINAKYPGSSNLLLLLQVQYWLNEISPGVKLNFENYRNADSVGLQYRIEDLQISNNYRPSNVGFGITYILPILVALLKAEHGDLIIIENPEAHLHPKGQRIIGELIARVASGGVQIIVESHSDHVLNGIRLSVRKGLLPREDTKLHFFEKQSSEKGFYHKITSPSIKSDGRLTMWPDGFFDEWDKALEELF